MTAPRPTGIASALRSPLLPLVIPVAIVLGAAALTPVAEFARNQGDVRLYFDNARAFVEGQTPYAQVPLEYPPLALVPMLVPYRVMPDGQPTFDEYAWLFAGWEALLVLALGFVLVRVARLGGIESGRRDPAWTVVLRYPVLVAGAALTIAWRFDLFAALWLAVALWATLANRPTAAGIALGLGVLAKLFPIVAAPALAIAWLAPRDDGRLVRFGLATVLTVVVGLAPFVAMAGTETLSFLGYQAQRGLEVESIGAGVVLLDGLVRGQPVEMHSPFKAVEVFGPLAQSWLSLLPLLAAGGFGALAFGAWRKVRSELGAVGRVSTETVATLSGAAVMVLLVTSKVFSIQYVVWLLPFAVLLSRWRFWLAAAVVALTMPIHPFLFAGLIAQEPVPILILNLRNALLVALTVWVVVDVWRAGTRPGDGREEWRARRDSNPRPSGPQPDALSAELRARDGESGQPPVRVALRSPRTKAELRDAIGPRTIWRRGRDSNPRSRLPHLTV